MERVIKIANDFLKALLIITIKIYQYFISPMLPATCRYLPTCSEYSVDALQKYGFIKGIFLIVSRLLRCHPWGKAGIDPVPTNKK